MQTPVMRKILPVVMMTLVASGAFSQKNGDGAAVAGGTTAGYLRGYVYSITIKEMGARSIAILSLGAEQNCLRQVPVILRTSTNIERFVVRYRGQYVLIKDNSFGQQLHGVKLKSEQAILLATDADKLMTVEPL